MEEQVREIARAADRASNLTRQLLAFSRKQVMQQKIVNLNEVLDNLAAMLRRLISEDIVLEIKCEPELPCVSADPAMIEQCLVNLVINARDAIGRDGCILIATSTRSITDVTLSDNPEARNGRFVCLTVTDTGCGMNEDVRNRLFEPFFTTKESGHGTGLGLATAYGIVKQHDGWIDVISEESHGSTFHIYLPINSGRPKPAVARMTKRVAGGTETILVVEDEPSVRSLACSILKQYGYNVLEAASGQEAMAVWAAHKGDIHLLLSDVIMPGGMTGGELAERLLKSRPDLHVVFTSGYSLEAVHDKVARVTHFLP
jgi:CheY-like chemotaxis protein